MHGQETSVYICDAVIDEVGVFAGVISSDQLKDPAPELKGNSSLWLDFEEETVNGKFYSYGIGARTYGTIWPDRSPQPEMWQIKKSGQPVSMKMLSPDEGTVEITNRYLFTDLENLKSEWVIEADGKRVSGGEFKVALEPLRSAVFTIPYKKPQIEEGKKYRLLVMFSQKNKSMWADAGFETAWEQFDLPWFKASSPVRREFRAPEVRNVRGSTIVNGDGFEYQFDQKSGMIVSVKVKGKELIKSGLKPNLWRAPLANETDEWAYWRANNKHRTDGFGRMAATEWYSYGLDRLEYVTESFTATGDDKSVTITARIMMMPPSRRGVFMNTITYTIYGSGEMDIKHDLVPDGDMPSWLPRAGQQWILDKNLKNVEWYGRGPQENYPDRKTGYRIGAFRSTVDEMYEPYLIPQDYGLRCDNQKVKLTDREGYGLEFSSDELFNFSAHPYSTENLTKALYTYQLQPFDGITFNLDYETSGVGCTALSVFPQYQVLPGRKVFVLTVKPVVP
jgi:beta-galactosidase